MDDDQLWAAIDEQRRRTADLLEALTDEQWDRPSLCGGWTVRHVASHLTLQQQTPVRALRFVAGHPRLLGSLGLNRFIHDSALVQARLPREEIVTRIRDTVGSRLTNAFLTPRETLMDIVVHGQDVALPLGLQLPVPPEVAAEAATRSWAVRGTWLAKVNRRLPLEGYRLVADDAPWSAGAEQGPEVRGPVLALLLLLTGRTALLDQLHGPGADALRREELPAA